MAALDQTVVASQVAPQVGSPLAQGELQASADQQRQAADTQNAKADGEVAAIRANARAQLAEIIRGARGVEAPANVPAPAAPAPVQLSTQPADMSAQLAAQFTLQAGEATKLRAEAEQIKSQAEARAVAAEAKLAKFQENPAAWMADEGIDIDQWHNRLVEAGGAKTADEKLRAEVMAATKVAQDRVTVLENQIKSKELAGQRTALEATLTVAMESYPAVQAMLGPSGFIDHMVALQRASPNTPIKAGDLVEQLEAQFTADMMRVLGNEKLRAKLGASANTPKAEHVANQGPRTISNKVTSSVSVQPGQGGLPSIAERRAAAQDIIRAMMANR